MGGGQSAPIASPTAKRTSRQTRKGGTVSITIKKPLGISIGASKWGSLCSGVSEDGNAARWNASCDHNDFDRERIIRVGDFIKALSTADNKMIDVSRWDPMRILDFFSTRSGPLVTLEIQRNEASPHDLKNWIDSRENVSVFEPMPLPITYTAYLEAPLDLQLQPFTGSTGRGGAVRLVEDSAAIRIWNKECERKGLSQCRVRDDDVVSGIYKRGVTTGFKDKSVDEIYDSLDALTKGEEYAVDFTRPHKDEQKRTRTRVGTVKLSFPTGLQFLDDMYGTVVDEVEGKARDYNQSKSSSRAWVVERGDYLVGMSRVDAATDDDLEELEGLSHTEVIKLYDEVLDRRDSVVLKFKRISQNARGKSPFP